MADSTRKPKTPERDKRGRWKPGKSGSPETQWGPGYAPPKSKGRPRVDAWVTELKETLEANTDIRQAIASRLLRVALKGGDQAALKAIAMIEDRVGGPVIKRVSAEITDNAGVLVVPAQLSPQAWLEDAARRNAAKTEPGGDGGT